MSFIRSALLVLILPLTLAACQTSQSAITTHSGSSLKADPVKGTKKSKRVFKNEAASLVVKPKSATMKKKVKKTKETKSADKRYVFNSAKTKSKRAFKKSKAPQKKVARHAKVSKKSRGKKSGYHSIIAKHARNNGVPLNLALAVVQVESNFRASARGGAGEVGLMQIKPRTARGIGYKGSTKNLYNPETNIRYGMKYLGKAYKLGGRSTCGAILKYNAGHGAKRMNPISRKYCQKVRRIMKRG